jgi:uncharacterized membrane protein
MWRRFYWLAAAVFSALATHTAMIAFLPAITLKPAIARISREAGPNRFFLIGEEDRQKLFPSFPSSSVAGACAFDVSKGTVELQAGMPPGFWTLTIYSSAGDVIYVLNDSQSGTGSFTVSLNKAPGLLEMLLGNQQDDSQAATGWTVNAADPQGLAVLWQPLIDPALRATTERAIAATRCSTLS